MVKRIISIIIFSMSPISFAQSDLDKIIVTPNLKETTIHESLNTVSVITKDEIKSYGYKSVDEILKDISSINIGSNGGYGQTKSIFLRGTESNHTKVLINGVNLNPGTLGVPSIQHISPHIIERIEISKNGMSTLYGRDTIGGVINIITTNKFDDDEIIIEVGKDKTNKFGLNKSFSNDLHNFTISFIKLQSDGYKAKVTSTQNHAYLNKNLNITYLYNKKNNNVKINWYQSFGNTEYDSFGNNLNQDHKDSLLKLDLTQKYKSHEDTFILLNKINKIDQKAINATDYSHTKNIEFNINRNYYNLFNTDTIFGINLTNEKLSELSFGTKFKKENWIKELYFQSEYQIKRSMFNFGSRYTNHNVYGNFYSGNINFGHALTDKTKFILSISKSFRSPDGTDLYGYGGNSNLDPEESINSEVSFKTKLSNNNGLIITLFNNNIKNLIESNGTTMQNINKAKIQGLEMTYYDKYRNLDYKFDYTLLNAKDVNNNTDLSRRPKNKLTSKINYNFKNNHKLGISMISSDKSDNSIYDSHVLGGYTIFNLTYLYDNIDYMWKFNVNNMLNKKYRQAHNYNSEGRSYYISFINNF